MAEFNNKKANEIMNGVIDFNTNDFAQCFNQMSLVRENVYQILSKTYPEEEVERMMDNFNFDFHFGKLIESLGSLQWEQVKQKTLVG